MEGNAGKPVIFSILFQEWVILWKHEQYECSLQNSWYLKVLSNCNCQKACVILREFSNKACSLLHSHLHQIFKFKHLILNHSFKLLLEHVEHYRNYFLLCILFIKFIKTSSCICFNQQLWKKLLGLEWQEEERRNDRR